MTAAIGPIAQEYEITANPVLQLKAGVFAHQDTMACIDTANACVRPGVPGVATLIPIGTFNDETDNTASASTVGVVVNLDRPVKITYWANDTTNPVTALFTEAYILDNQTVTESSAGSASAAGLVWKIDSIKGVGVVTPAF
jgi:hypothetical protein